jgi:hypothetical protein
MTTDPAKDQPLAPEHARWLTGAIDTIPVGAGLDRLVAVRVMGWRPAGEIVANGQLSYDMPNGLFRWRFCPSTTMTDTMLVVDALVHRGWEVRLEVGPTFARCTCHLPGGPVLEPDADLGARVARANLGRWTQAGGDREDLPWLVCRAALKTVVTQSAETVETPP